MATTVTACSNEPVQGQSAPLEHSILQRRLEAAGVPMDRMKICIDEDWERVSETSLVESPPGGVDAEEKKEVDCDEGMPENVSTVEIKTLVWEVSCNHQQHEGTQSSTEDTMVDRFYIVTALRMSDRVDLSLLRDLVYKQTNLPFGCTPSKLSLAPQNVAESLTGFKSGCIPPIGHTTAMKVYLDASILSHKLGEKGSIQDSCKKFTASIGSGILGHSLLLPMQDFIRVAQEGEKGLSVGSFIQQPREAEKQDQYSVSTDEGDVSSMNPIEIREHRKAQRYNRRPEPKDRLKEYRRFRQMIDKAKLLRTTARKKGRIPDMKALVDEAVRTGDFPELFNVSSDAQGMDKNALHLCAWRGDFETVQLLVETAKSLYPNLDLVNMISRGEGNYGKTPIFFALTQCREDVVRYLLAEGANLLIVNNKGQTPCSIAVSHLKDEACELLFRTEAQQLKDGGRFMNFRVSDSDHKLYGDLDPRFPLDNANLDIRSVGQDDVGVNSAVKAVVNTEIEKQLEAFRKSCMEAPKHTFIDGVPTQFLPRSIRPTTRWWVREARSLKAANELGRLTSEHCEITFTQPRRKQESKKKNSSPQKTSESPQPHLPDIHSLDLLKIEDVLEDAQPKAGDTSRSSDHVEKIIVDSVESLRYLEQEIDDCIAVFGNPEFNEDKTADELLVNTTWGMDCEWKPGVDCGVDNPVSTLQLSTRRRAFLVDLQSLCQDHRTKPSGPTNVEQRLCIVLEKLLKNPELPLIGYGILQDLGKLAGSFLHLPCFSTYSSVIDLQSVSSVVYPKSQRQDMSSLQKMAATLLGKRMDKTQQCSDWTLRPLSPEQLDYALLDAAALPLLLKAIVQQSAIVERYNGQFFNIHANLRSSIRFVPVEPTDANFTYNVPMGSIKRTLGQEVARQCWPTTHPVPGLPDRVPFKHTRSMQGSKKARAHEKKVFVPGGGKKPKPVQLNTLAGNLDNLPIPGITLGYTKESCVFRVVGHELLNTFPESTYIGFNRRAGVVETTNAYILFCNFGGNSAMGAAMHSKQYSDFYDGGRQLSFRLNPHAQSGRSSETSLFRQIARKLSCKGSTESSLDEKIILLFARDGTKSKYTYCGRCTCTEATPIENSSAIRLLFELKDFDTLMGEAKIASDFENLVASRLELFVSNK